MFLFHHCRSLSNVVFGEVFSKPEHADHDFIGAYRWLKKEVGFFPLFLAVGSIEDDLRMTGYHQQWMRLVSVGPGKKREYRKKGDFPNDVLFSFDFEHVNGVFMDYDAWSWLVLNSQNFQMTNYERRLIFKYSWSPSRWLKKVAQDPCSVQLVMSSLNLAKADRMWVRNKSTKKILEQMGFQNIDVTKVKVGKRWM